MRRKEVLPTSKDPVFRIFLLIIIGTILFQLLFNMITGGGGGMGDMGSSGMASSTLSFDGLVNGLLVLLVKLLIIALILSILIGIVLWIKKNFFQNVDLFLLVKQNPMLKSILEITAAIAVLFLLIYFYNYLIIPATGTSSDMEHSAASSDSMGSFSGVLGITGVVTFLVKILTYVFVITLIISLLAYFKKQIETGELNWFKTSTPSAEADRVKQEVNLNVSTTTSTKTPAIDPDQNKSE